ncbi:MAG TPA: hypothetical protein VGI10_04360 [Polyangiaceae bacterium]|jgi:hypothetical protein
MTDETNLDLASPLVTEMLRLQAAIRHAASGTIDEKRARLAYREFCISTETALGLDPEPLSVAELADREILRLADRMLAAQDRMDAGGPDAHAATREFRRSLAELRGGPDPFRHAN